MTHGAERERKQNEKTTPFGVGSMTSLVIYQAAQSKQVTLSSPTSKACKVDKHAAKMKVLRPVQGTQHVAECCGMAELIA